MAAPLFYSGDITRLDAFTLNVLNNAEVIDVDQDPLGRQGRIVRKTDDEFVLAKPMEDGSMAVGLFNLSEAPRDDHGDGGRPRRERAAARARPLAMEGHRHDCGRVHRERGASRRDAGPDVAGSGWRRQPRRRSEVRDDVARAHRGRVRPHRAGSPAGRLRRRLPDRHPRQHRLQAAPGARPRSAGHAGEGRRGLPDARRDCAGPGGRAGRRHRQPVRHGDDVRVPADGLQAVAAGRRHAGAGAGGLQHRLRAERRTAAVAGERPERAAERR